MSKSANKIISFSKDKSMIVLMMANLSAALAAVVLVLVRLRSHDFKVPVQYIANDGGDVSLASWYSLYSLGLFVLVGTGIAIFLAYRLYKHNIIFARGVLMAQLVVLAVSLLVINALLGLVAQL